MEISSPWSDILAVLCEGECGSVCGYELCIVGRGKRDRGQTIKISNKSFEDARSAKTANDLLRARTVGAALQ